VILFNVCGLGRGSHGVDPLGDVGRHLEVRRQLCDELPAQLPEHLHKLLPVIWDRLLALLLRFHQCWGWCLFWCERVGGAVLMTGLFVDIPLSAKILW